MCCSVVPILGKFKEDYNDIEKTIRDIIKSSGDGDIHRVLHTLKGVAGNIGANEIYQLTADIEDEIHGVTDIQLSALFEALFKKIRISIDEISKLELNHKEEYDKIIAYKKVNEETFAEVFDTLGDSIDNNDVEAEENINVIRGNLIHLGYVQQVDMMIKALGDYEFDLALEVYNQIAEKMNCGDEISDL